MTKLPVFISAILFLTCIEEKKTAASYCAVSCPCTQWRIKDEKQNIYLEEVEQ
ncbi:hypothetical protein [Flavobacterium anhuiense]|uniref:hypothetical protein n=1 Tax=Flavobacterium anhuiense TaxID=459526 RepID=UPI001642E995|nr:hypothetical protein [Flavobacterium anhuiense]